MKVLVVGSGGREHALCWAIAKSKKLQKLFCAPGNGGIAQVCECLDISAEDISGIVNFAKSEKIGLVLRFTVSGESRSSLSLSNSANA